ncbi:hypothetical protein CC1G_09979 [Coprinopsis cinerea okayama7|uniref:Secreted protein n=1 Tax=Coprinopsis cinerea (strain Okayama-7 / 130 / ATCC MYA-4618 / FGSC 9003) TaxID=240176 RepID=A8NDG3_COPC7|nr:hypothetical protein CC1G_09979 [Coprinopsis cinerea okayama7\|eukprot:XP_001832765.2 hypothetical protein CC1G_09979 [Coprinopsis cinerea okayama7\
MSRRVLHLLVVVTASLALPQSTAPSAEAIDLAPGDCPEIIPGPGLPSLKSLNLTSADLCKSPEEFQKAHGLPDIEQPSLMKRYTPWCSGSTVVSYWKATSCYNYLWYLGNTPCVVPPSGSRFCHSNTGTDDVAWYGTSVNGHTTQSTCQEVAAGGNWVLEHCAEILADLVFLWEGANAAWNNGNLAVRIGPY